MYRTSGVMTSGVKSDVTCPLCGLFLSLLFTRCANCTFVFVYANLLWAAFMGCFNFITFLLNQWHGNMKFEYVPVMLPTLIQALHSTGWHWLVNVHRLQSSVYNSAEQKLFLSRLFMLEVHTGLCCLSHRPCLSTDNQSSSICRLTNGDPIGTPQSHQN